MRRQGSRADHERQFRQACKDRLRGLDLKILTPFEARTFCSTLAERRGRPLWVYSAPLRPPDLTGVVVSAGRRDYIFYNDRVKDCQDVVDQIILHEAAHLIFDHPSTEVTGSEPWLQHLLPMLSALGPIDRVVARIDHSKGPEEQEAETLASLIPLFARSPSAPGGDTIADRLRDTLG